MRITNQGLLHNYLNNLNKNLTLMSKYQDQLSSGKEVRRPSDDPYAVTRSMSLRTSIKQNEQYLKNIEDSMGWVDMTDSALGHIGDILSRIRELTVKSANGAMSDTDLRSVRYEVEQLVSQIAQIGNTNYDGRYIFGGQLTTEPPFTGDSGVLEYHGATGANAILKREISQNVIMEINVPGNWILEGKNGELTEDLPSLLGRIITALDSGDASSIKELGNEILTRLDSHIDNILTLRSEIGAKYNRLEAAKQKNEEETFNMTDLLSKTEDIDFAEKIMHYAVLSSVYNASLSMGARILQPTLLDFLK